MSVLLSPACTQSARYYHQYQRARSSSSKRTHATLTSPSTNAPRRRPNDKNIIITARAKKITIERVTSTAFPPDARARAITMYAVPVRAAKRSQQKMKKSREQIHGTGNMAYNTGSRERDSPTGRQAAEKQSARPPLESCTIE